MSFWRKVNPFTSHGVIGSVVNKDVSSFKKVFTDPAHANFGQFLAVGSTLAAITGGALAASSAFSGGGVAVGNASALGFSGSAPAGGGILSLSTTPTIAGATEGFISGSNVAAGLSNAVGAGAFVHPSSTPITTSLSRIGARTLDVGKTVGADIYKYGVKPVADVLGVAAGLINILPHPKPSGGDSVGSGGAGVGDFLSGIGTGIGNFLTNLPSIGGAYDAGQGAQHAIGNAITRFFNPNNLRTPSGNVDASGSLQSGGADSTISGGPILAGASPLMLALLAGLAVTALVTVIKKKK